MHRSGDFRTAIRGGVRAGRPTLVVHAGRLVVPSSTADETRMSPGFSTGVIPAPTTGSDVMGDGPVVTSDPGMTPRVGFVVSKAVGNSVTRNRVERRLRHLVRPLLPDLSEGTLVVVRALPAAADEPDRLASDLQSAWSQALGKLERRGDVGAPTTSPAVARTRP